MDTRTAFRVTARLREFSGTLEQWKDCLYTLWRYQLTWDFAYSINVRENTHGVFYEVIVRPAFVDQVIDLLETLGCEGVFSNSYTIGVLDAYELEDIDDVILEW